MRFTRLRPMGWAETLDETLDAIQREAEEHTTEVAVSLAFESDVDIESVEWAVSKLRARAVVLACEVERLNTLDIQTHQD